MTPLRRTFASVFILAAPLLGVAACGGAAPETEHAVLVLANRANMPALLDGEGKPTSLQVADLMDDLASKQGSLAVIRADGLPSLVSQVALEINVDSEVTREDSEFSNARKIADAIAKSKATVAEADPLAAIALAKQSLADKSGRIIVVDNGLATAGQLLMQTGVLNPQTDVAGITKPLASSSAVGDLKGVTVVWYGMGASSAPQSAVPQWAIAKLKEIYSAVITSAGGTVEFRDGAFAEAGTTVTDPKVSVVTFEQVQVKGTPAATTPPPVTRVLDESTLRFVADSTQFADPNQAKARLTDVADELRKGDYPTVRVYGCTAKPPNSNDEALVSFGAKRAQTVVTTLTELGVTSRLQAESFGWACPGYVNETAADGTFTESVARKNRRVIITSNQLIPVS